MSVDLNEILIRMGLAGVSEVTRQQINRRFEDLLQWRVGTRLATQVPAYVLDAVGDDETTEKERFKLLQRAVPDYRLFVEDEVERITDEFNARYDAHVRGLKA